MPWPLTNGVMVYCKFFLTGIHSYGHSTPATDLGKIVTIVYAGIGIPLCMVMFQSMGKMRSDGTSSFKDIILNILEV